MQEDNLPRDGQSILALAARSMVQLFSSAGQGMLLVDRSGRIVWVNEGYQRLLPALGFSSVDQFVGHKVEDVLPDTRMREVLETGRPILIDLFTSGPGTFLVSRIPLRDEQSNELIGAIGIVLIDQPETTPQPLISKFALLQRELNEARSELASQRRDMPRDAERIAPAAPAIAAPGLPQRRATDLRPLAEQVSEVERQAIEAAMAHTRGNKFAAAKLLGISRAKLYERLEGLPEHHATVSHSVK